MASRRLTKTRLAAAGLGVFFKPSQVEALGITYDQLRQLEAAGTVECVAHGLYRLAAAPATEHYSVAAVCARVPRSIVCLLTALKIHGIGSQIPREVWIAIPHKARPPRVEGVKIRLLRFSGSAWTCGIQDKLLEGVPTQVTSPVRTIIDCFRFERLIGRETAVEALRDGLRTRKVTTDALFRMLEVLPSRRLKSALEYVDV